jgi:hypothetical protein
VRKNSEFSSGWVLSPQIADIRARTADLVPHHLSTRGSPARGETLSAMRQNVLISQFLVHSPRDPS